ncbi:MAG: imidazole glycerol phosphate synthase subunit HisH [Paracoccaceae bacterium]|nr:imidazole glycerol phosphate synthase subunit HisH [Paracoccaceae bacterium]
MTTVLIDATPGNLHSAEKAFQRMAAEVGSGPVVVSSDPEAVARAERVVLPGDGAFPACMAALTGRPALLDALVEAVSSRARPFFGICVGMQLLATLGEEFEDVPGLGWIDGRVTRIAPDDPGLKVPHMGWNDLVIDRPHPVLEGVATGDHAYFVHSYRFEADAEADVLAHAEYGGPVTAIVGRDNIVGTQFHPEKSQSAGLRMIANFLTWRP